MIPPTFHTTNYTIQSYKKEDLNRFLEMSTDKEVIRFMGGADGDIEKQTEKFWKIFDEYDLPENNETRLFWAIHQKDKLVGHVQLKPTDYTDDGEIELVYMVHPDSRNKGVMTEVLSLIKLKQHSWTNQVIVTVDCDNEISIKTIEKWGFKKSEERLDPDDGVKFWNIWLT